MLQKKVFWPTLELSPFSSQLSIYASETRLWRLFDQKKAVASKIAQIWKNFGPKLTLKFDFRGGYQFNVSLKNWQFPQKYAFLAVSGQKMIKSGPNNEFCLFLWKVSILEKNFWGQS